MLCVMHPCIVDTFSTWISSINIDSTSIYQRCFGIKCSTQLQSVIISPYEVQHEIVKRYEFGTDDFTSSSLKLTMYSNQFLFVTKSKFGWMFYLLFTNKLIHFEGQVQGTHVVSMMVGEMPKTNRALKGWTLHCKTQIPNANPKKNRQGSH